MVFNVAASAETSTICDVGPISSVALTVIGRFTNSCRFFCSYFRKPAFSIVRE